MHLHWDKSEMLHPDIRSLGCRRGCPQLRQVGSVPAPSDASTPHAEAQPGERRERRGEHHPEDRDSGSPDANIATRTCTAEQRDSRACIKRID